MIIDDRTEAERERDAAIARADRLEREAVASLTAAGICLPVEEPTAQGEIPMAVHKLAARAEKAEERVRELDRGISEVECTLVLAERSRDALGIQLAAQGERLRLAMAVVDAARRLDGPGTYRALDALDAVPGDALPHPTRHLEALGIDTDNVKGGE